jgi:hypothetical protein
MTIRAAWAAAILCGVQGPPPAEGEIVGLLRTDETQDVVFGVVVGGQGKSISVPLAGPLSDFPAGEYGGIRWDPDRGFGFRFKKVRSGLRLVYARWRQTNYFDWKWVEVREGASDPVALELRPSVNGAVELACPGMADGARVAFALPDASGKTGSWGAQPRAWEAGADVKEGKAVFAGLRPGRYVFYPALPEGNAGAPDVVVTVDVRAGETGRGTLEKKP